MKLQASSPTLHRMFARRPVIALVAAVAAVLPGCGDDVMGPPPDPGPVPIDPATQPAELSRALLIVAATNVQGAFPAATPTSGPAFLSTQESASVTADNVLYLPFAYFSPTTVVAGCFVTVVGADNYWDIPLSNAGTGGTVVVPIGMPATVLPGAFTLVYSLYDAAGHVGVGQSLPTSIVAPTAGTGGPITFPVVQGEDGLTVRSYDVGASSGTVTVTFDTYVVPDRLDIRAGGQWTRSTGTLLSQLGTPPILDCSSAGSADGFVGRSGTYSFDLDPGLPPIVDVYMSGCMNGGTAWRFQVSFTPAST